MGIEISTEARPGSPDLHQRSWQDLDPWRLVVALAAAPVLPILLGAVAGVYVSPILLGPAFPFVWTVLPAEIWSVMFGIFYLMTAPRRSGTITRANCIFAGGLSVVAFPLILMLLIGVLMGAELSALAAVALPFSVLAGLFLTPLGALGGWIFWLIGVRPAKLAPSSTARVFE